MMRLITDVIAHQSERRPDHPALVEADRSLSYRQLWQRIEAFANVLRYRFSERSAIGVFLPNGIDVVVGMFGVTAANMICIPFDHDMPRKMLSRFVESDGIKGIVTSEQKYDGMLQNRDLPDAATLLIDTDNAWECQGGRRQRILSDASVSSGNLSAGSTQDTAFVMHTTGTSGRPKGVMLSHRNLLAATANINAFTQVDSRIIECLPMRLSHSFGFARLRCVLAAGGTVILENGLIRPEWVLHRIKTIGANAVSAVPAGLSILLEYFTESFMEIAPQLKLMEIGSSPMPVPLKNRLLRLCPNTRIFYHYGLTEASRTTLMELHGESEHLNTVGRPTPGVDVRVLDESGNEVDCGTHGMIHVKGDTVMTGYWLDPELTDSVFNDGWLSTGDIGFFDESGYLNFVGRTEDIINIGGQKVAPYEIEAALLRAKGIREAAVIDVPSDTAPTGKTIKAFIVMEKHRPAPGFQHLSRHCLKELEPYKVPTEFEIVSSLPNLSGKLHRRALGTMLPKRQRQ